MDTFVEYMVKKKRDGADRLKIFGAILAALALTFIFGLLVTITDSMLFILWFALAVTVWYGVYVIISRQSIEYEYTFTNGELDIDAIYSKRRRVHLLTVRVRMFDICAPAYDESFKKEYLDVKNIKRMYKYASSMHTEKLYFADFLLNGDKVRLCFEPSDKMVEGMKLFNPRSIHTKNDTKRIVARK